MHRPESSRGGCRRPGAGPHGDPPVCARLFLNGGAQAGAFNATEAKRTEPNRNDVGRPDLGAHESRASVAQAKDMADFVRHDGAHHVIRAGLEQERRGALGEPARQLEGHVGDTADGDEDRAASGLAGQGEPAAPSLVPDIVRAQGDDDLRDGAGKRIAGQPGVTQAPACRNPRGLEQATR